MARRCASVSSYCEYLRCNFDPSFLNPAKLPRKTFIREQEPKPIDELTRRLLLGGIDSLRDQFLFTLFAATGLRVSEIQSLDRNSIVIERRTYENRQFFLGKGEVVGKGSKRRTFFVDEPTLVLYAQYLASRKDDSPALFLSNRGNRLSIRGIQFRLDYWCKRLGAPHLNVHRFRHSFATNLGNNHIDFNVLQKLMGHSSFNTTKKYLRLEEKTMVRNYFAAMELVNATNAFTLELPLDEPEDSTTK